MSSLFETNLKPEENLRAEEGIIMMTGTWKWTVLQTAERRVDEKKVLRA